MSLEAEKLLEAEVGEMPNLLEGVDLRGWLRECLDAQLDYQASVSSGQFDFDHPALSIESFAKLRALGWLGPEALPDIIAVLEHPGTGGADVTVSAVCDALMRMGDAAREAEMPLLERLRRDGIAQWPNPIVGALLAVTPDQQALAGTFLQWLDDRQEHVVLAALYALARLDVSVPTAKVLKLTRSSDEEVRSQAAIALGALGAGEPECELRLLELTSDSEWFVRGNAIDSLGMMGCERPEVLQAALRILAEPDDTPDWSAPECAARTVRKMGGQTEALRRRLLRAEVSSGLAEECIAALLEAGVTGWEDQVQEEFGYLLERHEKR